MVSPISYLIDVSELLSTTHSPDFCGSLPSTTFNSLIGCLPSETSGTACTLTTLFEPSLLTNKSAEYDGITCETPVSASKALISSF